jgi:hypothetical protein
MRARSSSRPTAHEKLIKIIYKLAINLIDKRKNYRLQAHLSSFASTQF